MQILEEAGIHIVQKHESGTYSANRFHSLNKGQPPTPEKTMKTLKTLLVCISTLILADSAFATRFSPCRHGNEPRSCQPCRRTCDTDDCENKVLITDIDADIGNGVFLKHDRRNDVSYSGEFDLTDSATFPIVGDILKIWFEFEFCDDRDRRQSEKVKIFFDPWAKYLGDVDSKRYKFSISEGSSTGQDLLLDGLLAYTVKVIDCGDVWLKKAKVSVEYCAVADTGTTFALFGLGLIGLAGARRFKK